nr:MAG TPA_asm: hypothetical protein [Caudoviricetes sp.]
MRAPLELSRLQENLVLTFTLTLLGIILFSELRQQTKLPACAGIG